MPFVHAARSEARLGEQRQQGPVARGQSLADRALVVALAPGGHGIEALDPLQIGALDKAVDRMRPLAPGTTISAAQPSPRAISACCVAASTVGPRHSTRPRAKVESMFDSPVGPGMVCVSSGNSVTRGSAASAASTSA